MTYRTFCVTEKINGKRSNFGVLLLCTESGSLRQYMGHECAKTYVCVLYCSPGAPLVDLWLGELEGTSLAIA